jgi:hypothetical protein
MPDQEHELDALYRKCSAALDHYITEAHNTCSLLGRRTKGESISLKSIIEQENSENTAHRNYYEVRGRLLQGVRKIARVR